MQLLERERHLADLDSWLLASRENGGCVALVYGEAGIGKTSLLHEFRDRHPGARILWGTCDALFTPRPLGPLHDIARQAKGILSAVLEAQANREEIFTAALNELDSDEPAVVVLEDMHWADEVTLDLLKFLGRRIHGTRTMLAITFRDDEVNSRHPLRSVLGDLPRANVKRISLSPLSESAVAELAARAGHAASDLYRTTGGNPLFVTEVLAADGDAIPASVRDAVLARMLRLSEAAREIAELVSIVPGKAESWLLEQAGRADESGIEGCLAIGMVRDNGGALAFRHELVRIALLESLNQQRLRSLHVAVLSILASRPDTPAARLVHHAVAAGDAEQVLRYARIAAMQATSVGAHRESILHFQAALEHATSLTPDERANLQEQLSYEYHITGQHERAIRAQHVALETWRSSGNGKKEGNALRWLSRLSLFASDMEKADQYGIEAVAKLESMDTSPELAMAYCERADFHTYLKSHDETTSAEWAQRAIAIAQPWGDSEILSHALCTLGTARLISGKTEGWADLHRSLTLATEAALPDRVAAGHASMVAMAVSRRDYELASQYLHNGLAYCEHRDMDWWWLYMLAFRVRMRFEQGDWNGASDDAETVLRHPRTPQMSRIPVLRFLGHLRIRRGDPRAHEPLNEARILSGSTPSLQIVGTLAAIESEHAFLTDDHESVISIARPAYALVCETSDPRMKGELAAWLWRAGALEQHPTDIPEHYALEISGDWRGAAHAWRTLNCPYEHASMLAWYGTEVEQRESLAIFEHLGAAPAASALRRRMRARGVRKIPRGARASTLSNPFGLTRREAEVLELLHHGPSNSVIAKRLFVSIKTVDHHVSSILTKLGVQSRSEAIAKTRQWTGDDN